MLGDLDSDIGLGAMVAALAPHKGGLIRDGVILSVHAAKT